MAEAVAVIDSILVLLEMADRNGTMPFGGVVRGDASEGPAYQSTLPVAPVVMPVVITANTALPAVPEVIAPACGTTLIADGTVAAKRGVSTKTVSRIQIIFFFISNTFLYFC